MKQNRGSDVLMELCCPKHVTQQLHRPPQKCYGIYLFIFLNCYNKVQLPGWLKQENLFLSWFWRPELKAKDLEGLALYLYRRACCPVFADSGIPDLPWHAEAVLQFQSLPSHGVSSLSLSISNPPPLHYHLPYPLSVYAELFFRSSVIWI